MNIEYNTETISFINMKKIKPLLCKYCNSEVDTSDPTLVALQVCSFCISSYIFYDACYENNDSVNNIIRNEYYSFDSYVNDSDKDTKLFIE